MVQREFWASQHPTSFQVTYSIDPLRPEDPPGLLLSVHDQEREPMMNAFYRVPLNVVYEAVQQTMIAGWEGYLFGTPGGIPAATASVMRYWKREALARARRQS